MSTTTPDDGRKWPAIPEIAAKIKPALDKYGALTLVDLIAALTLELEWPELLPDYYVRGAIQYHRRYLVHAEGELIVSTAGRSWLYSLTDETAEGNEYRAVRNGDLESRLVTMEPGALRAAKRADKRTIDGRIARLIADELVYVNAKIRAMREEHAELDARR